MKNFNVLQQEYLKILSKVDESFFNVVHEYSKEKEGLSGLFLASEPDHYWTAKNRIMIVGAETRGWNIKLDQMYDLEHYIFKSIEKNKNFFQKMMLEARTKKLPFTILLGQLPINLVQKD